MQQVLQATLDTLDDPQRRHRRKRAKQELADVWLLELVL